MDTSIWIEYFKGNKPYFQEVPKLSDSRMVYTSEPVFGELLQGALNKREKGYVIMFWKYLPKIGDPELFIKAGIYVLYVEQNRV